MHVGSKDTQRWHGMLRLSLRFMLVSGSPHDNGRQATQRRFLLTAERKCGDAVRNFRRVVSRRLAHYPRS
jgi:hypothetical protein